MRKHYEQSHPDEIHVQRINKKARLVLGETASESLLLQPSFPTASGDGNIGGMGENGPIESEVEAWMGEEGGFESGFDGGFDHGGFEADRYEESSVGDSSAGKRELERSCVSSTGSAVRVHRFP